MKVPNKTSIKNNQIILKFLNHKLAVHPAVRAVSPWLLFFEPHHLS
jgi:hypothetical protein